MLRGYFLVLSLLFLSVGCSSTAKGPQRMAASDEGADVNAELSPELTQNIVQVQPGYIWQKRVEKSGQVGTCTMREDGSVDIKSTLGKRKISSAKMNSSISPDEFKKMRVAIISQGAVRGENLDSDDYNIWYAFRGSKEENQTERVSVLYALKSNGKVYFTAALSAEELGRVKGVIDAICK